MKEGWLASVSSFVAGLGTHLALAVGGFSSRAGLAGLGSCGAGNHPDVAVGEHPAPVSNLKSCSWCLQLSLESPP